MLLHSKSKRDGLHSISFQGEFRKSTTNFSKTLEGISKEIKKDISGARLLKIMNDELVIPAQLLPVFRATKNFPTRFNRKVFISS